MDFGDDPQAEGAARAVFAERAEGARAETWLVLLRRLDVAFPDWAAWKNVDSAFHGTGDIDAFAPRKDWDGIRDVFVEWAREVGFGPVIVCHHVLLGPHLIALEPGAPFMWHLDIKERSTFRGSTLLDVPRLKPLLVRDPRGFRRIRPGADGVVRLCSNGVRPGGARDDEALAVKRVRELLRADPEGVEAMAASFGPAEGSLMAGVRALLDGGWDRGAMRRVERWAAIRGLREPQTALRRQWFRRVGRARCRLMTTVMKGGRRIPDDREAWLAEVATNHDVITTGVS